MRARFSIVWLLAILFGTARPVQAQALLGDPTVTYTFGKEIVFQAALASDIPVESAFIFFGSDGEVKTEAQPVSITTTDSARYDLRYVYDLTSQPLRAFSVINYRFEITLSEGQALQSDTYRFYYEDNRFKWKTLSEEPFRVYWVDGDVPFAQDILDVAQAGQERIEKLLPLTSPEQVKIYIYSSSDKMQDTLNLSGQKWIAGHADPDLGVMVVSLPPGPDQRLLMEQRIPHELMHILLYQAVGESYGRLPTWLNEGLASVAELYPNPDYQVLLDHARQEGNLLPMGSLCQAFPRDASNALLAYAQSASFTRYLQQTQGASGLTALLESYRNGVDCDHGVEAALGKNLAQFELEWRREVFAENAALSGFTNFLPWLTLLAAALAAPLVSIFGRFGRRSADPFVPRS